jgi:epoxyqueuosine reductase
MRAALERMVQRLAEEEPFEWKICVDTAPLLERSFARLAGLGWIGKNTCLINEPLGSWFFLGEIVTSLDLTPGTPPPDRCGTCSRCIDACPTQAIVPEGAGWTLDSRRCISYLTVELRGSVPEELRTGVGENVFGCDICQDVCPWNSRAPVTADPAFAPVVAPLEELASLSQDEFRRRFADTPVARAKYTGLLRNVAVAMGNADRELHRHSLEQLAAHPDPMVREHAQWAFKRLMRSGCFRSVSSGRQDHCQGTQVQHASNEQRCAQAQVDSQEDRSGRSEHAGGGVQRPGPAN